MLESLENTGVKGGWRMLPLVILCAVLPGCTSLQPDSNTTLERQIERQQEAYKLSQEPEEQETLTPEEYETMGDRYLLSNDINRAYLYYIKALTLDPENVPLLHKQGKLLAKKEKFPDAEFVYRKILSISKKDALAYEGLGRSLLGQRKIAEAEEAFLAAIAINRELWQSHHFLALVYSTQQKYEKAIVEFKQALSYKPGESSVLNNLAVTYYLQGHFEEAETILRGLARITNDRRTYNNLAITYAQLGKYSEALSAFKKGAKNEASAYNNIGIEYLVHEKYEEAIKAFEKAIALNPKFYPSANANLARAQKALQR